MIDLRPTRPSNSRTRPFDEGKDGIGTRIEINGVYLPKGEHFKYYTGTVVKLSENLPDMVGVNFDEAMGGERFEGLAEDGHGYFVYKGAIDVIVDEPGSKVAATKDDALKMLMGWYDGNRMKLNSLEPDRKKAILDAYEFFAKRFSVTMPTLEEPKPKQTRRKRKTEKSVDDELASLLDDLINL
jgi:hypothetical protein